MNWWPWSKQTPAKAKVPSPENAFIAELRQWRPIGGRFEYLGRPCVVTAHFRRVFYAHIGARTYPGIQADYVDDHGVIHNISFNLSESLALMEANP